VIIVAEHFTRLEMDVWHDILSVPTDANILTTITKELNYEKNARQKPVLYAALLFPARDRTPSIAATLADKNTIGLRATLLIVRLTVKVYQLRVMPPVF